MTPQDRIRKLAEDCLQAQRECEQVADERQCIYAAILEGVKLALAEPSQEMRKRGNEAIGLEQPIRPSTVWRAMAAARLRELGKDALAKLESSV